MQFHDPSIDEYLTHSRLAGHRPATLHIRELALRLAAHHIGHSLLEATPAELADWYRQYVDSSTWTRITYGRCVRVYYTWAVAFHRRSDDPSAPLPIPRRPDNRPRPMPLADLDTALHAAAADPLMFRWLALGAYAGLRAGEIARLRREHLHDDPVGHPLIEVIDGKGGRDGEVVVGPHLARLLALHRSRNGRMWDVTPRQVTMKVSQFFADLGLPWTCHSLRHTYCTYFQRASHDTVATMEQARHRSIDTTLGYIQVDRSSVWGAVVELDARLSRQLPEAS